MEPEALVDRHCVHPATRLEDDDLAALLGSLGSGWHITDDQDSKRLRASYSFADFAEGLAFVNRIGELAEAENHHPDLHLRWGQVTIEIWTHSVGGLSENDFIFAARADALRQA